MLYLIQIACSEVASLCQDIMLRLSQVKSMSPRSASNLSSDKFYDCYRVHMIILHVNMYGDFHCKRWLLRTWYGDMLGQLPLPDIPVEALWSWDSDYHNSNLLVLSPVPQFYLDVKNNTNARLKDTCGESYTRMAITKYRPGKHSAPPEDTSLILI